MRKRNINKLVAMALVCGLGINTLLDINVSKVFAASSYTGGSGTAVDPYLISTPEELNQFRLDTEANLTTDKYYKLANDIDLSTYDTDTVSGNGNWTPIKNTFQGTLDGDGHAIDNVKINLATYSFGFFKYVGSSAVVKNINFKNVDITGQDNIGSMAYYNYGKILNSSVQGKISATSTSSTSNIGGVVSYNAGLIANVNSDVDVSSLYKYGGGVVYYNDTTGTIIDTYAKGTISATNGYIAGMVYYNYGAVKNVVSAVKVNSTTSSGGLTAGNTGYILNSYWDKEISGQANYYAGSELSIVTSPNISGLTTSEMQGENAKANMSLLDFENTWAVVDGNYPTIVGKYVDIPKDTGYELYESGTGTESDPYMITNPKQLYMLAIQVNNNTFDTSNKYYALANDIDFTNYDIDTVSFNGNWIPIGTSTNPFRGVFDGNNKVIKNLSINDYAGKYSSIGLFAYIQGSTIKNLGLEKTYMSGGTRSIAITSTYAGGLVGYVGDVAKDSFDNFIQNCFFDGDIEIKTTGSPSIGGLVGSGRSLRIDNSYAKGNMFVSYESTSSANNVTVGGIIGYAEGLNTYTSSILSPVNYGGMLVNKVYSAMNIKPCIKGVLSTSTRTGQIIGLASYTSKLQDAYWDKDVYNSSKYIGSTTTMSTSKPSYVDVYGLTTSEMQGENAKTNMRLLDFNNTWKSRANNYPTFKANADAEMPSAMPSVSKLEDGKIELVDNNPDLYKADIYYKINTNSVAKINDWTLYTTPFEPVYDESGKFNLEVKSINKYGIESEIVSLVETKTDDEVSGEVPTTPTPEVKPEPTPNLSVDKDLSVNVSAENSLEMSLSTNEISFLNYSGTQDFENSDLAITISSGIAYDLNATLKKVLTDKLDETNKMEASLLGVKLLSDEEYQFFAQEGDSKTLITNAPSGNDVSHGVGIKLKGDSSVKPATYQGLINFVAIQK